MNRRSFFQSVAALMGTALIMPYAANAEERRRGGTTAAAAGPTLVDPKNPQAVAVSYVEKHADLKDKKLQADRNGVKWAEQKCENCAFFQKDKEATVSGKKAGPCNMPFAQGKFVVADGWCTTWAKKS